MKKTALPSLNIHKGQSIVEVVLSIGIAALVIGALVILGSVSLRTALSAARRTEGTRVAVSGLEAMRYYRDTVGFDLLVPGCYQISNLGVITSSGSCPSADDGWQNIDLTADSKSKAIFNRKIEVTYYPEGSDSTSKMRKVTVTVRWPEGTGVKIGSAESQKDVVMSVVLSKWK